MPDAVRRSPQAAKNMRDFFRYPRLEAGEAIALK
jgi:hypothetical protein